MNRRNAIVTLSGVLATSALLAAPRRALAQTGAAATLDRADYKTQTLMVGTLSKEQSQLAATRAVHPRVKEFAEFEVSEQTVVAQCLTMMANPPPATLDARHQAMLTDLQGATGKAFDTNYVQAQLIGHRQLRAIQQDYLNGNPGDADDEHIAMMARMVIDMHLTMLQDLQNMLTQSAAG